MSDPIQKEEDFSKYRILIADDNELEREVLVHTVESMGAKCDVVSDGDELATKLFGTECGTYHFILTDIYMPGKNGYEVCREYRASRRKDAATLPFIGISADNAPQLFETAVNAGMNGMTNKPPTKRALSAYFTLLLTEGRTNVAFAARVQSHLDELSRLQKALSLSDSKEQPVSGSEDSRNWSLVSRLKKVRLIFFIFMIILGCFLLIIFRNARRVQRVAMETELTFKLSLQYHEARNLFRQGTDALTAAARQYATLGDYSQVEAYFHESQIERHRDQAIQMMRALSKYSSAVQVLEESMTHSMALMEYEYHAMKLIAASQGREDSSLPKELQNYTLTNEEKRMSPEKQREKAIRLVFDDHYNSLKNKIMKGVEDSQEFAIEQNHQQFLGLSQELDFLNKLETSFMILIGILLLGFLGMVYFLYRLGLIAQEKVAVREALKARDKAIAAERAKSYFFTSISHDIRTPLNSILGFTQLLQRGGQTEAEQKEFLSSIISSSNQLLNLVNDLLDISRLEAGRLELKPAPFNARKLVEEVVLSFRPMEKQTSLTLTADFPTDEKFFPILDGGRLRQVLVNLLGNAFKFTKTGGIHLSLHCDKAKRQLLISVKDTGCGISPQNLSKLMQPFVQLSHMDRTNGTGLGLAISRQIIELMGGTLTVTSQVGKGSTFTIQLNNVTFGKEADEETDKGKKPAAKLPEGKKIASIQRVLLVDDVKMNLIVIRQLLKTFGITQTECANSGKEALEKLEKGSFDLILTDMCMPEMSGEELVRIIRADARWRDIPTYGVTGDVEVLRSAANIGLTGVLLKPVTLQSLQEALGKG